MPLTLCPDPDSRPCCFHLFWESLVHSLEISTDVTCWWESFISLPVYMYYHYSCLTVYSLLSLVLMLADGTQSFYHQLWCCKLLCFYVCIISFIKFTFSPICWGPLSWTDIVIAVWLFYISMFMWFFFGLFIVFFFNIWMRSGLLMLLSTSGFLNLGNMDRFSYRRVLYGEDCPVLETVHAIGSFFFLTFGTVSG